MKPGRGMNAWPGKFIIDLTGNSATGKSVVSQMLKPLGANCSDANTLGHSISIRITNNAHFIPTMQDQAAQLMDDILAQNPIEVISGVDI